MLKDGLFGRFPCDAVLRDAQPPGHARSAGSASGPAAMMAGGAFFDIHIEGKGAHGARPERSVDPVLVAAQIGTALQAIVARNVQPGGRGGGQRRRHQGG